MAAIRKTAVLKRALSVSASIRTSTMNVPPARRPENSVLFPCAV